MKLWGLIFLVSCRKESEVERTKMIKVEEWDSMLAAGILAAKTLTAGDPLATSLNWLAITVLLVPGLYALLSGGAECIIVFYIIILFGNTTMMLLIIPELWMGNPIDSGTISTRLAWVFAASTPLLLESLLRPPIESNE